MLVVMFLDRNHEVINLISLHQSLGLIVSANCISLMAAQQMRLIAHSHAVIIYLPSHI